MLRVELTGPDGVIERLQLARAELTFGRVPGNDVILPRATISKRHARVVVKDGKVILVDLKSMNGTWVNGRRLSAPYVLAWTDRVAIADFGLRVAVEPGSQPPMSVADLVEQRLLAATRAREPGSCDVYADWLEERGEEARAEYLRLQDSIGGLPPGTREHPTRARARVLAGQLDVRWRIAIARVAIEGCARDGCPRDWGALEPAHVPELRTCSACGHEVHFCRDGFAVRTHLQVDRRAVLDPAASRWPAVDPGDPDESLATVEVPVPTGS